MLWAGAKGEKETKQTRPLNGTECESLMLKPALSEEPEQIEA
jgi:hypothetical protein